MEKKLGFAIIAFAATAQIAASMNHFFGINNPDANGGIAAMILAFGVFLATKKSPN